MKFVRRVYTTRQYNTQIKNKAENKNQVFIEVKKVDTYIRIGLGFSLYKLTKTNRAKGGGNIKTD